MNCAPTGCVIAIVPRFPRPCQFGHVAVGFLRATFPLARFRRGLIHQTQDGCRCAVADDGLQRDAAGHEIGGGDGGCVVGAMNRPTSPLRGSGSGERSGASLFSPPPLPAACRFTGFCGWKYTSSTTETSRGLNPFEIRAGLKPPAGGHGFWRRSLNPFEIRAGLKPHRRVGRTLTLSLNPFEIRAGLKHICQARTLHGHRLNPFEIRAGLKQVGSGEPRGSVLVLIPLKSGLV